MSYGFPPEYLYPQKILFLPLRPQYVILVLFKGLGRIKKEANERF